MISAKQVNDEVFCMFFSEEANMNKDKWSKVSSFDHAWNYHFGDEEAFLEELNNHLETDDLKIDKWNNLHRFETYFFLQGFDEASTCRRFDLSEQDDDYEDCEDLT